jgi:hypothetical protein
MNFEATALTAEIEESRRGRRERPASAKASPIRG